MQLDIVSDTVCPWCYIGKRQFQRAMEIRGKNDFDYRWRAYQLDPTIPQGGVDRKAAMERKFGPDEARAISKRIYEAGEEVGLTFNFDKIKVSPNTLDSHRVIRWAGSAGVQDEIVEIIFRRYFTDGEDIGRHEVLVDAAREAGMDAELVAELLPSDADKELIRQEDMAARDIGVSGVPTFILNNQWVLMGAQQADQLARMFDKLVAKHAAQSEGATA